MQQCRALNDSLVDLRDSVERRCSAALTASNFLSQSLENAASAVVITNDSISIYNLAVVRENREIVMYNNTLSWSRWVADKKVITTVDSLDKALRTCVPGDTIFLDSGTYVPTGPLQLTFSGEPQKPIVLLGNPANPPVVKDPSGFVLSSRSWIDVYNITFSGSSGSGLKIENKSMGIKFHNCTFTDNGLYGLDVIDSDVDLFNCIITRNTRSGLNLSSDIEQYHSVNIANVLIAKNQEHGIDALTIGLTVMHSTISDNGGNGLQVRVGERVVVVGSTILSFNGGYGITRFPVDNKAGMLNVSTCVLFANAKGALAVDTVYHPDYLVVNPGFADHIIGDYRIIAGSGIEQLEKQGIVIGYRK